MIELHYHPRSTFSRRVRIALLEKDIPFRAVELDMQNRAHKSPEYLALNPYGRVPTIVDDGFVLYESTAILEYLEATHPTPPLLPAGARARATVAMHMKLADVEMGSATGTVIFPKRFLPKERWDTDAMAKAQKRIQTHLGILEKQLGDRTWLTGSDYTLADVCYTPFAEFFHLLDLPIPPGIAAWAGRLLARPSAVATKPDI